MNRFNLLVPVFSYAARAARSSSVNILREHNSTASFINTSRPATFSAIRYVSSTPKMFNKDIVLYEEFKEIINDKSTLIIDVREPQELKDTGVIPGSINIPLGEVEDALKKLDNEEFKKKYGQEKPSPDSSVVFTCLKGIRSAAAMETAKKVGIKNARNFLGGWAEWEEKTKTK